MPPAAQEEAGPVPCGTYTAHKDREARRDEQGAARMLGV